LGLLIGQKAWPELGVHTRGAINNGMTELEIREAALQATIYCGNPSGIQALQVTQKTINDMIENQEYKRPENQ
jgi:4-carboxymuconolactone decarboxylase